MLNRAEEDYIKTIYELTIQNEDVLVKTNVISEYFGYTDQSVNEMIKKLAHKKLVSFLPYKGVKLTSKGRNEAIRMVRVHRIWEVFLTEKLGFSWEEVHEDAEKLEHATSEDLLEHLYAFLGKPSYCQHGNPIPDENGMIKPVSHFSLDQCSSGDLFKMTRVIDFKALLRYLNQEKISLYDVFEVIEKDDFNHTIKIIHKHKEITISLKTAKMLFGEIVK
jgi:DtxR family transcriptional regulator, Mn-dependent transcriptional regulator